MEWLIGPVTFYCGSAAEPRQNQAVTDAARFPAPALCTLTPRVHFHL